MRWLLDVWWKQWTWPLKLGTLAALVVLLLVVGLSVRSCFKGDGPPALTPAQVQEAQKAIATDDRQKQVEILAQSDAQEATADAVEANAAVNTKQAVQESKEKWAKATNDELRQELERRAKGQ